MDVETELVEFCEEKKNTKPLRLQEVETHEGGKAVFTSDSKEMKILIIPSGIETATFRRSASISRAPAYTSLYFV